MSLPADLAADFTSTADEIPESDFVPEADPEFDADPLISLTAPTVNATSKKPWIGIIVIILGFVVIGIGSMFLPDSPIVTIVAGAVVILVGIVLFFTV